MDNHESYKLQQEIDYWTNLISAHKKNSNIGRSIASNSHSIADSAPQKFVWNKAKTKSFSGKTSVPVVYPSHSQKPPGTKVPAFHFQSTSSSTALSSNSFVKPQNGINRDFSSFSNKPSYKWKKTNSVSNVKQISHTPSNMNPAFISKSVSVLPKSKSMPVLNKDNYKWEKPSCTRNETSSGQKELAHCKKPSALSNTDTSRLFRVALAADSLMSKNGRANRSKTQKEKDESRFKWNKNARRLSAFENAPKLSSPSLKRLLVAKAISSNSRFKYTKRRKSWEKYASNTTATSNTLYLRKKILTKYKLLRTPDIRSRVNTSKNPYKVVKKTVVSPNKYRYNSKYFANRNFYKTRNPNIYQQRRRKYQRSALLKRRISSRNPSSRYKPYRFHNRFKYVRRNVQTRSRNSGNIVLKRKQQPVKITSSRYAVLLPNSAPTFKQRLASNALQRSLEAARLKGRHRLKKVYCIFYNRFGKCNRGDKCPYTHDPDRVAICTQFLRGSCRNESCPFSHKTSKQKMPVCTFFLRGNCSATNCRYLHVFLGRDAPVCKTFATTGYCSKAEECKQVHLRVCPDFYSKGKCDGKCNLPHRRKFSSRKRAKQTVVASLSQSETSTNKAFNRSPLKEDGFISLLTPKVPSKEARSVVEDVPASDVRIQPRLKLRKVLK